MTGLRRGRGAGLRALAGRRTILTLLAGLFLLLLALGALFGGLRLELGVDGGPLLAEGPLLRLLGRLGLQVLLARILAPPRPPEDMELPAPRPGSRP
jgi:hypothetical protein